MMVLSDNLIIQTKTQINRSTCKFIYESTETRYPSKRNEKKKDLVKCLCSSFSKTLMNNIVLEISESQKLSTFVL